MFALTRTKGNRRSRPAGKNSSRPSHRRRLVFESLEDRLLLSFGTNGMVLTDFGGNDGAGGVAIQSDGRIVAVGNTFTTNNDFALARYNTDGSLDPTFDRDGKVTTAVSSKDDSAAAVALQSDGKIIAAGSAAKGAYADFALVRYNVDGGVDTSFGSKGKVLTDFFRYSDHVNAVAIQADGKIVAAGYAYNPQLRAQHVALARYNPDGSLDRTFDGDGKVTTAVGFASRAYDAVIQPDGAIVVVGSDVTDTSNCTDGCPKDLVVIRYNSNGTLDTSFGGGGIVTTTLGSALQSELRGVALQPDGQMVAAGYTYNPQTEVNHFALGRYNPDGSLDATFDGDGIVTTLIGSNAAASDVAVDANGKIVAAGNYIPSPGAERDFAMVRYNQDGSLDGTFGVGGIVTTVVPGNGRGHTLAIQSDGKLVRAGYAFVNSTAADFVVVRNNPDGSLDAGDPPLTAASLPAHPRSTTITTTQAQPLLAAAFARWEAAGVDTSALGNIQLQITNLGGRTLGMASGNTILLDDNAAGWGWFVDATPGNDSEYLTAGHQGEQGRMDLLTAIAHELGHLLGYDHADGDDVMAETLATGTRHTPTAGHEASQLAALDIVLAEEDEETPLLVDRWADKLFDALLTMKDRSLARR